LTKRLSSLGLPTTLQSYDDLNILVSHMKSAIDDARIWEYYVFDVQSSVKEVHSVLEAKSAKTWGGAADMQGKSFDQLAIIAKSSPGLIENLRAYSSRCCTKVQPQIAAGFAQAAFLGEDATSQASKWGNVLDVLNVELYAECNDDLKSALDCVSGRLQYTRLDEGGPKMGEINEE